MISRYSLLLYFILFSTLSFSQPKIDFTTQKTDKGIAVYATNLEACPVSTQIAFSLSNLSPTTANQTIFLIPAKANNYLLTELIKINNYSSYKYSYKLKSNFGDITLQTHDSMYEYDLPFEKGNSFKLHQAYNGKFSHQNINALDFTMPEGTPVVAARDGIVVSVVQRNIKSCPNKSCIQYCNSVIIYHSDGTFGEYAHIKFNGSKVNVGDSVKQGDIIALSGNTGFTLGPHLHFECYLPGLEKRRTVETYFKIGDGSEMAILEESEFYTKNY
jgi:murein DD-endopeptidase MepM/ murein hydrolase activator NlpD